MQEPRVSKCRKYRGGKRRRNKGRRKRNPGRTSEGPCSGKPRGDHLVGAPRGSHKGSCQRLGRGGEKRSRASLPEGPRGGGRDRFFCNPPRAAAMSHLTDREALAKCVGTSSRSRPCAMATLRPLRAAAGRYFGVLPGRALAPAETPVFTPVTRRPRAPRPLAGGPRLYGEASSGTLGFAGC